MNIKTEPVHPAEFIISESPGRLSREAITLTAGDPLPAGQLLILDDATSTYRVYTPESPANRSTRVKPSSREAEAEPSTPEPTLAVLVNPVPADTLPRNGVACVRLAEVSRALLTGLDEVARHSLAARFLIVR